MPAARTKMELNTDAPRKIRNQVIAFTSTVGFLAYLATDRKKSCKNDVVCFLTYDAGIIAANQYCVYPQSPNPGNKTITINWRSFWLTADRRPPTTDDRSQTTTQWSAHSQMPRPLPAQADSAACPTYHPPLTH